MTRLLPLSLLALGGLIGCARHVQPNSDCEWPHEIASGPLNLSQQSQLQHLRDDAEFAEDLGIRYADVRRGPPSGHFEGMPEYGRTRDQCITALFKVIGMEAATASRRSRSADPSGIVERAHELPGSNLSSGALFRRIRKYKNSEQFGRRNTARPGVGRISAASVLVGLSDRATRIARHRLGLPWKRGRQE